MWLSKKTRRPIIAKRFQSRQKVLYEYCLSLLRDRVITTTVVPLEALHLVLHFAFSTNLS